MAEAPTIDLDAVLNPTPEQWRQEVKEQAVGLWMGDRGLALERVERCRIL